MSVCLSRGEGVIKIPDHTDLAELSMHLKSHSGQLLVSLLLIITAPSWRAMTTTTYPGNSGHLLSIGNSVA